MSEICGLCGKENVFIGEQGICCSCCQLLAISSAKKEDIYLINRGLSSPVL